MSNRNTFISGNLVRQWATSIARDIDNIENSGCKVEQDYIFDGIRVKVSHYTTIDCTSILAWNANSDRMEEIERRLVYFLN